MFESKSKTLESDEIQLQPIEEEHQDVSKAEYEPVNTPDTVEAAANVPTPAVIQTNTSNIIQPRKA